MFGYSNLRKILTVAFALVIFECDTKKPIFKDGKLPEITNKSTSSKWIPTSFLDVWYGKKDTVDVLKTNFADVITKFAIRPCEYQHIYNNLTNSIII